MMNILFSFIALITCTISQTTVVDVVTEQNLTSLAAALTAANLINTLEGPGPFTVFAPTNDAFTAVSPLPTDVDVVTDILLYHVVGATVLSTGLSDGLIATTVNGQSITVQIDGSNVYFYDSMGRRAMPTVVDLVADNGVVHIIDMVLLPDGKVSDITSNVDDLSTLNGALEAYGLDVTLSSNETSFTLFAPTNDAVAMFTGSIDDNLLLYHVLAGAAIEADGVPTTTTMIPTANGNNLTVYRNDSNVFVMDTFGRTGQVTVANLVATNGIVHIIDIVLAPTATIAELVSFRDDLTILSNVLNSTGLSGILNNGSSGNFTLFAPTDDAFTAIADLIPSNLSDVQNILLYHVLAGEVFSYYLSSGLVVPTVLEFSSIGRQPISVQIDSGVFIYDTMGRASQVTQADIECTNGVIHIVDTVLLPDGTIADVTANVPELDTLNGALVAYGLDATLASDGNFTLFAPSDDAVAAFDVGTIDMDLLLYHVLAGQYLALDVPEEATALPTLNADMTEVTVQRNGSDVFITDAIGRKGQVTMANVATTNGVVHVIDIVLQSTPSVVELVSSRDDLSTLAGALDTAGLISTLEGDGPFTIFAPTNDAFDAIADSIPTDTTELAKILKYHVVYNATVLSTDLYSGLVAETLISQSISVQIDGGVFIYDTMGMTSEVTEADLECRNGVIHIIDAVLLPDGTIADVTANIDSLSTLDGALVANDLDDTLMGTGPFTLFAPTNDAVSAFSGTIDTELLLYHVTTPQYLAADVPTTSTTLMSANADMDEFTVIRNDSGVFITDATGRKGQVTVANIVSTNGVVHIIDIVLESTPTIVQLVSLRDDLSTLAGALTNAGLISTLSGDGPFTVFAPTNDAFDAITVPSNVTELAKILKYHVLNNMTVLAEDISSGLVAETFISQSISFQKDNGVFIYDTKGMTSEVTEADLDCMNGVIHIIDAVLLPDGTIADVTKNVDSLSTLDGALVANDLDDVLMTAGPFTLFAPTNDAVSAFTGTIDSEVLLYHVLSGQYLAADVPTTATALATANTDMTELTVVRNDNGVFVTDQDDRTGQVTMANIISTNGVVHVIDIVLSPEDIMPQSTMDETTTEEPNDPDMSSVYKLSPTLSIFFFCFVCMIYFN